MKIKAPDLRDSVTYPAKRAWKSYNMHAEIIEALAKPQNHRERRKLQRKLQRLREKF